MANVTLTDIGALAGILVTLIGLITLVRKPIRDHMKKDEELRDEIKELKELVVEVIEAQRKHEVMHEKLNKGSRELLRYRLERECERAIQRGYITSPEVGFIRQTYDSYHSLGGNGAITALVEETMTLGRRNRKQITIPEIGEEGETHDD